MLRMSLYFDILLLTFACGVAATGIVDRCLLRGQPAAVDRPSLLSHTPPQFIAVGHLLETDYHLYWYKTTASTAAEEITLYGDFTSAQVTREHFMSNATTNAARLLESGSKFDIHGKKIGRRGISLFAGNGDIQPVRIFWTDGDIFWFVQAPSLELALEFEQSEIVQSITMSNKRLQQARHQGNLMESCVLSLRRRGCFEIEKPDSTYAVTVDASHDAAKGLIGVGIVVENNPRRTGRGLIIEKIAESHSCISSQVGKMFSVLRGLEIAKHRGFKRITLRSDYNFVSTDLRKRLRSNATGKSELEQKVLKLAKQFKWIDFTYVPRHENQTAYLLARQGQLLATRYCSSHQQE